MKIVRIFSLVEHPAMVSAMELTLQRGDNIIAMCRAEDATNKIKELHGIRYIDPSAKGYFAKVKRECEGCDYIFLHSLAEDYTFALHMLLHPSMMNKAVWIIVGGDLYSWARPVTGNLYQRFGAYIRNWIASEYRKKIPYVICSAIDKYKYNEDFGTATVYSKETNNPGFSFSQLELTRQHMPDHACLRIMIGHSSSIDLNHEEVIYNLSQCGLPENTEYVFPLSYGNAEYGDRVEKAAIKAFGNQAIILRERMPFQQYAEMLWSIDCAIFHTDRQIAFGNLLILLYMKKRIFLKKGSVMYRYFLDRGVKVFDSSDLNNEILSESDGLMLEAGKELAKRITDRDALRSDYKTIMDDLEKRLNEEIDI